MSLFNPGPHVVTPYTVAGTATTARGFRANDRVAGATLACLVTEDAPGPITASGRAEARHTHRILFPTDPRLTPAHLLVWTRPGDGRTVTLKVIAQRRPQSPRMPYVAFCEQDETGQAH